MQDDDEAELVDEGVQVFIRWVLRQGIGSEKIRPFLTLAAILCKDMNLLQLRREAPVGWVDEELVDELLSLAKPAEVVSLLSYRIGPDISPELFKKIFDRTLAATSDFEVHSRLVFEAGMFLQLRHPGAFQIPKKLVDQLLASEDYDHQLAGLKALPHTTASFSEILAQFTIALKRFDGSERWAALSPLSNLLEAKGSLVAEETEPEILDSLRKVLTQLETADPDVHRRRAAAHCRHMLGNV